MGLNAVSRGQVYPLSTHYTRLICFFLFIRFLSALCFIAERSFTPVMCRMIYALAIVTLYRHVLFTPSPFPYHCLLADWQDPPLKGGSLSCLYILARFLYSPCQWSRPRPTRSRALILAVLAYPLPMGGIGIPLAYWYAILIHPNTGAVTFPPTVQPSLWLCLHTSLTLIYSFPVTGVNSVIFALSPQPHPLVSVSVNFSATDTLP